METHDRSKSMFGQKPSLPHRANNGGYGEGGAETLSNDHHAAVQERCERSPQAHSMKSLAWRILVKYEPQEHRLEQEPHDF